MRDGRQRAVEDEHVVARELPRHDVPDAGQQHGRGEHVDVRAQEIVQRTHQAVLRAIHETPDQRRHHRRHRVGQERRDTEEPRAMQLHRIQRQGHQSRQAQHDRHLHAREQGHTTNTAPELAITQQARVVLEADELGAANHLLLEERNINGVHDRHDEHEHEHHRKRPHEFPSTPIGLVLIHTSLARMHGRSCDIG